eukprot:10663551-Karenia_brevis.AAC.1
MAYAETRTLSSSIVGLHEAHGGAVDALVLLHRFYASYRWHLNPTEDSVWNLLFGGRVGLKQ